MNFQIKNILLVEDDPLDVELTLMALAEDNPTNKVQVAPNGAEALDYLYCRENFKTRTDGNPAVVLLDLKTPKVNGLEVLKTIKSDEQMQAIPVVVFSSSRETADLIECYKHGANSYVVKPVDFADFVKAVKQLVIFWATINEPFPHIIMEKTLVQSGEAIFLKMNEAKNGIPAPHSALGG